MEVIIREVQNQEELQQVLSLRHEVFIEEQGIPAHLDKDGKDPLSKHVIALDEKGDILAGGRLSPHPEGRIGILSRISVSKSHRGKGLGKKVIAVLERIAKEVGYTEVQLKPHVHLESFYQNMGYQTLSKEKDTAGKHPLLLMKKDIGG